MEQRNNKKRIVCNARYTILLIVFVAAVCCVNAQTTDSLYKPPKDFRNIIKLNVSSRILYNNSFMVSYERVIGKHQGLNVFAGYQELPVNINLNLANTVLGGTKKKTGYSFGLDYKFYLAKENKDDAPHGIYLAPFVNFYSFISNRTLTHTDSTGIRESTNLNTRVNFFNAGGELGYQFVLGKRWVIDAILFGPAFTHYNFHAKLDNALPGLDENEAAQAAIDALKEKFPLLNDLSSDEGINKSGTEAFWSVGFRYNVSIGFRF
jgi:hypothetical protein